MRPPADIAADCLLEAEYIRQSVAMKLIVDGVALDAGRIATRLREAAEALRQFSRHAYVTPDSERAKAACREVIELLDIMEHPIKPQLLAAARKGIGE